VAADDRVRDHFHVLVVAVQRKEMDWGRLIAGFTAGSARDAGLGAAVGATLGALGGPFVAITVPGGGRSWGGTAGLSRAAPNTFLDSTATMQNVVLGYMAHSLIKTGHHKDGDRSINSSWRIGYNLHGHALLQMLRQGFVEQQLRCHRLITCFSLRWARERLVSERCEVPVGE
jgi:hypothetical protein